MGYRDLDWTSRITCGSEAIAERAERRYRSVVARDEEHIYLDAADPAAWLARRPRLEREGAEADTAHRYGLGVYWDGSIREIVQVPTYITVGLCAHYDLYQSGDLPDEAAAEEAICDVYLERYRESADELARKMGVVLAVEAVGENDMGPDFSEPDGYDIWQELHDQTGVPTAEESLAACAV